MECNKHNIARRDLSTEEPAATPRYSPLMGTDLGAAERVRMRKVEKAEEVEVS